MNAHSFSARLPIKEAPELPSGHRRAESDFEPIDLQAETECVREREWRKKKKRETSGSFEWMMDDLSAGCLVVCAYVAYCPK
jgi:hypothetical protein